MLYDPDLHHRRSIRLRDYDYTQGGAYFLTVCVHDRACLLGEIVDGDMRLSDAGRLVAQTWDDLPSRFPAVELDAFVIMPNHVHGILVITNPPPPPGEKPPSSKPPTPVEAQPALSKSDDPVGAGLALPKKEGTPRSAPTLGDIVGAFKSLSAIACNRLLNRSSLPFWQRNYWEHIIRDDADLARLRTYIEGNPGKWAEDKYHLSNTNMR